MRAFAVALIVTTVAGRLQPASAQTAAVVPPQERLLTSELVFNGPDDPLERIYQGLVRLCGAVQERGDTCLSRNMRGRRERVALLYSEPSLASAPAAQVMATPILRRGETEALGLALEVETIDQPGVAKRWIDDVGDFGYGIHLDGDVRRVGDWAQLVRPAAVQGAWLPLESPTLRVFVDSIEGSILELDRLPSSAPRFTEIPAGSYFIVRVESDVVELRDEIESDMPCEDPAPPRVLPPVLQASASQFFDPDGRPRFRTKYTKGC